MARLIETSLWIEFIRAHTPAQRKLAIQPWILDPSACLCEPIAFEVLRHAKKNERKRIEAQFDTLQLLPTPATLWRDASRLGQLCQENGFNAGSLDLLIATLAIHHDAELVTADADYLAIARSTSLRLQFLTF